MLEIRAEGHALFPQRVALAWPVEGQAIVAAGGGAGRAHRPHVQRRAVAAVDEDQQRAILRAAFAAEIKAAQHGVLIGDGDLLYRWIEEGERFQPAGVHHLPGGGGPGRVAGAVGEIDGAVVIVLRPEQGLAGALPVAAGKRIPRDRAGLVAGRDQRPIGAVVIAVLDLPREIENLAGIAALMVGAPEAGQKHIFESGVPEEIARLMRRHRRRRQVLRCRGRLLAGNLACLRSRSGAKTCGNHAEAELFSCQVHRSLLRILALSNGMDGFYFSIVAGKRQVLCKDMRNAFRRRCVLHPAPAGAMSG